MKFAGPALTASDLASVAKAGKQSRLETQPEGFVRMGQLDRHSLEELLQTQLDSVLRIAVRLTGSNQRAEELVGEAMLRAVKGLDSYRGDSEFKTWLYRIPVSYTHLTLPTIYSV